MKDKNEGYALFLFAFILQIFLYIGIINVDFSLPVYGDTAAILVLFVGLFSISFETFMQGVLVSFLSLLTGAAYYQFEMKEMYTNPITMSKISLITTIIISVIIRVFFM